MPWAGLSVGVWVSEGVAEEVPVRVSLCVAVRVVVHEELRLAVGLSVEVPVPVPVSVGGRVWVMPVLSWMGGNTQNCTGALLQCAAI